MRRTQHAIAVMVVATALCADGKIANASSVSSAKPAVGTLARQLATRLSSRFQQVVPAPRLHQDRQERTFLTIEREVVEVVPVRKRPTPLSPFQFRLPPPASK